MVAEQIYSPPRGLLPSECYPFDKLDPDDQVTLVETMFHLFVCRTDTYLEQNAKGQLYNAATPETKYKQGPERVRAALTAPVAADHLRLARTIGVYMTAPNDRAKAGCIDLDEPKPGMPDVWAACVALVNALATLGIQAYIELTRRGYHIWVFFSTYVHGVWASDIRRGLAHACILAGVPLDAVEINPKQTYLDTLERVGNGVRLPFGIHRKSGLVHGWVNLDGTPLGGSWEPLLQLDWLRGYVELARYALPGALAQIPPEPAAAPRFTAPSNPAMHRSIQAAKDATTVRDWLWQNFGIPPAQNLPMALRCPFHNDDKSASVYLDPDGYERFRCHVPHCPAHTAIGGRDVADLEQFYRGGAA
jgi:hypothetical protein